MGDGLTILAGLAIVAGLIALAVWGYQRHKYVNSFRNLGWQFDTSPSLSNVVGLNNAPFGIGLKRKVDDMFYGNASNGVPFKVLEYEFDGWKSQRYVAILPLPSPMPFLFVRPADRPTRIPYLPPGHTATRGTHTVVAANEQYAHEVGGLVLDHLGPLAGLELSIDHASLVIIDTPASAEEVHPIVEAAARLVERLADVSPHFPGPTPPQRLSFADRPHWGYIPQDSSWLARIPHTTGGFDHEAHEIVFGESAGISFIRLEHRWKTRERDSDGDQKTVRHTEYLCQHQLAFPFHDLDLGSNPLGIMNDRTGLQFESTHFNSAYKVTSSNPKFAHDVLHPRTMEWLLHLNSPKVRIDTSGSVQVRGYDRWSVHDLVQAEDFLFQFFARVPNFVWQNLGAWPRPIPELRELRTP